MSSLNSKFFMWRCQFIKLIYVQFLHDLGCFDSNALNSLDPILSFSKDLSEGGFPSLLAEEISIIEARNLIQKRENPLNFASQKTMEVKNLQNFDSISHNYSSGYISSNVLAAETSYVGGFNTVETKPEEKIVNSENFRRSESISNNYSPLFNDEFSSISNPLPTNQTSLNNLSSESMINELKPSSQAASKHSHSTGEKHENGGNALFDKLKNWLPVKSNTNQENQKQITKAKMGKPNSLRFDEKLKKWVDDNDTSTSEKAPKLPPPPINISGSSPEGPSTPILSAAPNFRAKKGKVKYFDPLNPEGPSSSQLQPSVPNFDQ